jgi:N-acetylmuramoyl-L-alanine amidase
MINLKIYPFISYQKQDKKRTFAQKYEDDSFSINGFTNIIMKKYFQIFKVLLLFIVLIAPYGVYAQDKRFTVVIDAGHGGHDPGAMGSMSREKDINLAIALDLGYNIEQSYKDVKVVYTRKTDVYLTLQERADIVNDNHADLFFCIHTNASQSASAFGSESFTLGLAKTKANLDVAMRENSVILLEKDYRTKYKGFDPTSVDSYIMFEFMQDKYIDNSVELASGIQKQFVNYCNRSDRGVRQAGFWVLHRSACPSVLVEVGFISNASEERYLSSKQGQNEMAKAIYNAFVSYKRNHDKKSGRRNSYNSNNDFYEKKSEISKQDEIQPVDSNLEQKEERKAKQKIEQKKEEPKVELKIEQKKEEPKVELKDNQQINKNTEQKVVTKADKKNEQKVIPDVVSNINKKVNTQSNKSKLTPIFKVQIFASVMTLKDNASDFKGLHDVNYFTENGLNKYTVGSETDYSKIEKIRKEVSTKFPEAFIIAFVGDNKISAKEAQKLIK